MLTAPSDRIDAPRDRADGPSHGSVLRDEALVAVLRQILAIAGIRESCSAEQEGIFFALEGHDEVSLHYNMPEEEERRSSGAVFWQKAKGDMFACGSILAERGFAVTLVVSLRTLALFVRSEAESKQAAGDA